MAQTKYQRFPIPAVGAGVALGETQVATPDDSSPRTLRGVLSTNQTKLISTVVLKTGTIIAIIDDGVMAQQRGFIPLNTVYESGKPMSVDVRNASAGALAANTDAIVLQYEV